MTASEKRWSLREGEKERKRREGVCVMLVMRDPEETE